MERRYGVEPPVDFAVKPKPEQMTDQEIRIAIAEACGFEWKGTKPYAGATHPDVCLWSRTTDTINYKIPDYPNDLNAMAEAEKTLRDSQTPHYVAILSNICGSAGGKAIGWPYITATARQRATAFLKTTGKWKD